MDASSQSNLMAWELGMDGGAPVREAMRVRLPFEERRWAIRAATLPVPPVRRIAPLVGGEDIFGEGGVNLMLAENFSLSYR